VCIVAPAFEVVKSDYYGFVGFSITMVCRIIFHGLPFARFGWRRKGQWLRDDDDYVTVNATHFSLTLRNLSTLDSGNYRCASEGVPLLITKSVDLHIQGSQKKGLVVVVVKCFLSNCFTSMVTYMYIQ